LACQTDGNYYQFLRSEARAFGMKTGMDTWEAKQKYPHIIFVVEDNRKYASTSSQIVKMKMQFTPLVEVFSIDEAFLNLTGFLGSIRECRTHCSPLESRDKASLRNHLYHRYHTK
jgi:nucleotidyltransferase/DNA polymerase involved in DNA repair